MSVKQGDGLPEDFDDFFERSMNGYLTLDAHGNILRANLRFAGWVGKEPAELQGTRFHALLSIGSRMFYETHLAPLLKMQGFFEEVAVELLDSAGAKIRVLVNALERRGAETEPPFVRLTFYKATERLIYEQNLRRSKQEVERELLTERELSILREQFIAILGHDLRNPLGAISLGAALLAEKPLERDSMKLVRVVKDSAARMIEMIDELMEFARVRMGGGLGLEASPVLLEPVLLHVVEELRMVHPGRHIETEIMPDLPVCCDAGRISQVLSNLLANALIHGDYGQPIRIRAVIVENELELSVCNGGSVIPPETLGDLFLPFTRRDGKAGRNGLGLGLYIASEIAKAHDGALTASSTPEETRFTFRMPVNPRGTN